ncbi:family 1 glycosylhydrolase [Lacticaseibacillus camelliae]|uniref:family 1 glycosylhydrolase n=1 Tax=Lacticaseibacillus camelliae TaxID=381742 RepID=UPI0006D06FA0|nr:family 1 glycosylhydrolase [Lacticaseibacillus camelliae]
MSWRLTVSDLLHVFRQKDKEDADDVLLKSGKPDYLGVNYYHEGTIQQNQLEKPVKDDRQKSFNATDPYLMQPKDAQAQDPEIPMYNQVDNPFLKQTEWSWDIDPAGFRVTLRELTEKYGLPMLITENGLGASDELKDGKVDDGYRIDYLKKHVQAMQEAITDGCDVIGYCAWSFTDLLSWLNSYKKRYSFVYVDRDDDSQRTLDRIPKKSYYWYQHVIATDGADLTMQS